MVKVCGRGANGHWQRQDADGQTPLHLAADRGHMGIVEVLLEHKADINLLVCPTVAWCPATHGARTATHGARTAHTVRALPHTVRALPLRTPWRTAWRHGPQHSTATAG